MAIDKGFKGTSEANLTNLIGNLFVPAAFCEFKDFNIFSTSPEVTKILREQSFSEKDLELTSDFKDTRMILVTICNTMWNISAGVK